MRQPEDIPHVQQLDWGYCLPACAEMALRRLGIEHSQAQLASLLGTRPGVGTPFSAVVNLADLNIAVELVRHSTPEALAGALLEDAAVVVALTTTPGLPGWRDIRTQHTVLVSAITPTDVTYHDPVLDQGPTSALLGEFLLAWSEMDETAVFLRR